MGRQADVDAGVLGQLLWRLRLSPFGEIGWRSDHRHAQVRADPHRDHVLRHLFAETDSGVVALRDDVGETVIDDELDLDVGIARQQRSQSRPQDGFGGMLARGDAERAGRLVAQRAERRQLALDLLQPRPDVAQQPFAGLGRRHAARGPGQQPQPEPLLEPADGVAQRRWRQPELGGCAGKAPLPRHREKGRDIVEIFAGHL